MAYEQTPDFVDEKGAQDVSRQLAEADAMLNLLKANHFKMLQARSEVTSMSIPNSPYSTYVQQRRDKHVRKMACTEGERERERERGERVKGRKRGREREERERERREKEKGREERERERGKEMRDRERDREKERKKERKKERDRESERSYQKIGLKC